MSPEINQYVSILSSARNFVEEYEYMPISVYVTRCGIDPARIEARVQLTDHDFFKVFQGIEVGVRPHINNQYVELSMYKGTLFVFALVPKTPQFITLDGRVIEKMRILERP